MGSPHPPNFACWNIILRGRKCARGKKNGEDRGGEVFEIYGEGDMQMEQILLCSDASHARNEGILLKLAQRAHSATRKGRAGIEEGNFERKVYV